MAITKLVQIRKYLQANHTKIREETIEDLAILDGDLKEKDIFLTGENHGVSANVELRMKFLRYFKNKTNFKYYLWELPYSTAYFLNKYLETGDKRRLNQAYSPLKGTDAYNKDDYKHWEEVYKFNQNLDKANKISVIGIDIEHQPINALKFIEETFLLVMEKNPWKDLAYFIEGILEALDRIIKKVKQIAHPRDLRNSKLIKDFSYKLNRDLKRRQALYEKVLGEDYFSVKLVNENLLNMYQVYGGNNFNHIRDGKMYKNFIKIYREIPYGKYYGQLGLSHIFQKSFPYVDWLGAQLNKHKNFKDRILSIAYVYKNCKYLYPTLRKNYISSINTLDRSMGFFTDLLKDKYTIFKLNGENSPFEKDLIWPISHKYPKEGTTTDYIQYMVVIENSTYTKPFTLKNLPSENLYR